MRRNAHIGLIAIAMLLVCIIPALAQQQAPAVPQESPPAPGPKLVTLDLKNVPLDEAINRVIAATNLSVIIAGPLPKEPRVTMRMTNVDPIMALQSLATAGNIFFRGPEAERGPEGWASAPALLIPAFESGVFGPGSRRPGGPRPAPAAPEAEPPPIAARFIDQDYPVDLDVKDVPFREAVQDIVSQIPAGQSNRVYRVVVDDSVPQGIRVTARLRRMRFNWVLGSLIEQANLAYTIDTPGVMGGQPLVTTVYIVPKPELHVSGGSSQ